MLCWWASLSRFIVLNGEIQLDPETRDEKRQKKKISKNTSQLVAAVGYHPSLYFVCVDPNPLFSDFLAFFFEAFEALVFFLVPDPEARPSSSSLCSLSVPSLRRRHTVMNLLT